MKKRLNIIKLFIVVMYTLALQSCKDNCQNPCHPDCETYNPCNCETPLKADFVMKENYWLGWAEIFYPIGGPIDGKRLIRYEVTTPHYDSCLWILGNYTSNSPTIGMKDYPKNSTIDVMLIVYKSIDARCVGKLKSADTLIRSFTTADNSLLIIEKQWPLFGTYIGYKKSNPSKEVIVTIDTIGPLKPAPVPYPFWEDLVNAKVSSVRGLSTLNVYSWGVHLTNIPYDNYNPDRHLLNTDGTPQYAITRIPFLGAASFMSTFPYGIFDGYGALRNNELHITYSYHKDTLANGVGDPQSPVLNDEYIGQKIK